MTTNPEPRRTDPQVELLDLGSPARLSDQELRRALTVLSCEARRRAVERCDPSALIEEAFTVGFTAELLPKDPWLRAGILVCPGAKLDRSVTSHRCAFVQVDSHWVWDHPDVLQDSVRHLPGPRARMQSVSLVPVADKATVDLVEARTRHGVHELVSVRSFLVDADALTLVSQRAVGRISHR